NIRSNASLTQRKPQDQAAGGAVDEMVRRVFTVGIAADAEIAAQEEIHPAAGAQTRVLLDPVAGKIVNRLLADGTAAKSINRKFVFPVKGGRIGLCRTGKTRG